MPRKKNIIFNSYLIRKLVFSFVSIFCFILSFSFLISKTNIFEPKIVYGDGFSNLKEFQYSPEKNINIVFLKVSNLLEYSNNNATLENLSLVNISENNINVLNISDFLDKKIYSEKFKKNILLKDILKENIYNSNIGQSILKKYILSEYGLSVNSFFIYNDIFLESAISKSFLVKNKNKDYIPALNSKQYLKLNSLLNSNKANYISNISAKDLKVIFKNSFNLTYNYSLNNLSINFFDLQDNIILNSETTISIGNNTNISGFSTKTLENLSGYGYIQKTAFNTQIDTLSDISADVVIYTDLPTTSPEVSFLLNYFDTDSVYSKINFKDDALVSSYSDIVIILNKSSY